jgi:HSP20 family protein
MERSYGSFQRSMRLPYAVNPDEVRADFENGVLTVSIPKSQQQQRSNKIPIKGASSGQARLQQSGQGEQGRGEQGRGEQGRAGQGRSEQGGQQPHLQQAASQPSGSRQSGGQQGGAGGGSQTGRGPEESGKSGRT